MEEKRKSILQLIKQWWENVVDAISKIEIY
jgi:hypothetical protein